MKTVVLAGMLLCLAGCKHEPGPPLTYQRFVLVPNPSGVNKDVPAGALALDTKTGLLCYTVGGDYKDEFPAIDMCNLLFKDY
jgi:hypothetical protein